VTLVFELFLWSNKEAGRTAMHLGIFFWIIASFLSTFCIADTTANAIISPIEQNDGLFVSGLWALLQLVLVLVSVIALAYLVLHKGVGFFVKKNQANQLIQIKERLALDQKHFLYLVNVENRRFLMGTGDSGVCLISELSATEQILTEKTFSSSLTQGASHFYDKANGSSRSNLQAES
jgi:flagellar biogenesis protein FliO